MTNDQFKKPRRPNGETPEEGLTRRYWEKYRLTVQQYDAIAEAQGGVCAICGKPPKTGQRLAVDHCHATTEVMTT